MKLTGTVQSNKFFMLFGEYFRLRNKISVFLIGTLVREWLYKSNVTWLMRKWKESGCLMGCNWKDHSRAKLPRQLKQNQKPLKGHQCYFRTEIEIKTGYEKIKTVARKVTKK